MGKITHQSVSNRMINFTNNDEKTNTFMKLSGEVKPTSIDGARDGDGLLLIDTKDIYIFYKGTWYLQ